MAYHGEKRSLANGMGSTEVKEQSSPVRWQWAQRDLWTTGPVGDADTWVRARELRAKCPECHRNLKATGIERERDTWV